MFESRMPMVHGRPLRAANKVGRCHDTIMAWASLRYGRGIRHLSVVVSSETT